MTKELVNDALQNGSKIFDIKRGQMLQMYCYPVVLFPVNKSVKVYQEEQFGLVVPIVCFSNISEPLKRYSRIILQRASKFGIEPLVDILANLVCRINLQNVCQGRSDVFIGRKNGSCYAKCI